MSTRRITVFLFCLAVAGLAEATSVRPLTLNEIVDTAAIAFQGTCTGNRTDRDPLTGLVVTYTTFDVKDALKGNAKETHTIKQVGGTTAGNGKGFHIDGIPTFIVGEDYVVLLAGVSKAGFSSPVGLAQGRFAVQTTSSGKRVSNGRNFADMNVGEPVTASGAAKGVGLASAMKKTTAPDHQLDLDEFKQLVRKRAGNLQ